MSRTVGKTDNFHPGFTGRQLARLDTYGSLAQLVEQRFYTAKVGGSNPSGTTKFCPLTQRQSTTVTLWKSRFRNSQGQPSLE